MMRVSSWLDHVDERSERAHLVSMLRLQPGQSVLVVAVGTGRDLPLISLQVGSQGRLLGVDLSRPMLNQCRRKTRRLGLSAGLVQAEAAWLPIASATFDAVLLFGGLNSFRDRPGALLEIVRVTRCGGEIVISDKSLRPRRRLPLRHRLMIRLRRESVLPPPIDLMPFPAQKVSLSWFWGGTFYILAARKP
jgi:ubiquinone/menaquinone biosynthesis C-methylase UbiE